MEGKTVLAIAHRLSTIARMDRIIVMDEGKIFEDGTHEVLLAKGGLYARYWNRQSGGFIGHSGSGGIVLAYLRKISNWVDPFAPAKGAPPQKLWAFFRWCTSGSGYVIFGCVLASALLGSLEW